MSQAGRYAERVVPLSKPYKCPECGQSGSKILRVDTPTHVELYCILKDCGVMIKSTPRSV